MLLAYILKPVIDVLAVKVDANVRLVQKKKGLSQESLALNAKIDRSYMERIEGGEANITLEILYQLAKVLDGEAKKLNLNYACSHDGGVA
jgi:transcriptional regulator with XRE-family HTH domain